MAMTAPTPLVDEVAVLGLDLIGGSAAAALEAELVTERAQAVIAVAARRLRDRRQRLLVDRGAAAAGTASSHAGWTTEMAQNHQLIVGPDFCADDGVSWERRLAGQQLLSAGSAEGVPVARIRGWDRTEAAVLVDGAAAPACIVDAVLALHQNERSFDAGWQPIALCLPDVRDAAEARLWQDMLNLVQDRLGIPRRAVPVIVSIEHTDAVAETAAILAALRANAAGVCIASGRDLDEVAVKEAATTHGIRWVGAIPASATLD